ncbi:MAG: aminopeptidase, partial [Ignavibacteriaceae bacterium]|nr:aminopeptidase [Ignavibacteriaceae bacterium]
MSKSNFVFSLLIFSFISFATFCQQVDNPEITSEEIKQHIGYFASDELKGRDSGTKEIKEAADYISNEFKNYGLEPIFSGSYLQEFPFIKAIELTGNNSLTFNANGKEISPKLWEDYITVP